MANLKQKFNTEMVPVLQEKLGMSNVMAVPRLKKVVINMGVGQALTDKKHLTSAVADLEAISGQKVVTTKARKSVASFKIREGYPIGCKVTLRGERMYDFVERLINIAIPTIKNKLSTLNDVGLGYITLGQSAITLSGGEAQRIKLAKELSKRSTGKTLFILDEPTTGLHFADIELLLKVLERLKSQGNTIAVIEHNLDVVKTADWVIDLGPEGGSEGGKIIAEGTPEDIAKVGSSYTGIYLKEMLKS